MMRAAVLAMMLGVMMPASGGALADEGVAGQEKSLGKEKAQAALSEAEREEATLAATLFVEMADRGLYKEIWPGMLQVFRDLNEYRSFERLLIFRKKAITPIDHRKVASAELVDVSASEYGRGRFALVVFCTRSEGIMFIEALVLKQEAQRNWIPAGYKFKMEETTGDGGNRQTGGAEGPCAYLTTSGMGV